MEPLVKSLDDHLASDFGLKPIRKAMADLIELLPKH